MMINGSQKKQKIRRNRNPLKFYLYVVDDGKTSTMNMITVYRGVSPCLRSITEEHKAKTGRDTIIKFITEVHPNTARIWRKSANIYKTSETEDDKDNSEE